MKRSEAIARIRNAAQYGSGRLFSKKAYGYKFDNAHLYGGIVLFALIILYLYWTRNDE